MATPPRRRGRPQATLADALVGSSDGEPALLGPLDQAGLSTRAAERLRSLIIQGHLLPGQQIAEGTLSAALGISRTPLREALRQLAGQGLVVLRPNRGALVAPLDPEAVQALFETLSGIERLAAECAAERGSEADLRRLASLQIKLRHERDAHKLSSYFGANQRIHLLIVKMAANPTLSEVHASLFPRAERGRFLALEYRGRWDESIVEHEAILNALRRRNAVEAGKLLAVHVAHTGEAVIHGLAEANAA